MIIDASVWVAAFLPQDHHHVDAASLLRQLVERDLPASIPLLALAEIAGAIARRSNSTTTAEAVLDFLTRQVWLECVDIDHALGDVAARVAARYRLRGADAVYVALAISRQQVLITLDAEMSDRSPDSLEVLNPRQWLEHG